MQNNSSSTKSIEAIKKPRVSVNELKSGLQVAIEEWQIRMRI